MKTRLSTRVAIADIEDAEAFVAAAIRRTRLTLTPQAEEELIADGLLILVRLHDTYQPRMKGYAQDGRFSGYAARYLPRKLLDAWHRQHPEHVRTKTGWTYHDPPAMLDALGTRRSRSTNPADAGVTINTDEHLPQALHHHDQHDPFIDAWT